MLIRGRSDFGEIVLQLCKKVTMLLWRFFFVGWAISRCLSTTLHPINRARGGILLVLYSMVSSHFCILMAVVRYNHIPTLSFFAVCSSQDSYSQIWNLWNFYDSCIATYRCPFLYTIYFENTGGHSPKIH